MTSSTTQQRRPWKLRPSCDEHTGKHLRYSIILVKLLDKLTRITLDAFATKYPSHKHLVRSFSANRCLQDFQDIDQKSAKIVFTEKFFHQKTGRKILHSRICGNFLYISHAIHENQSSRRSSWVAIDGSWRSFPLLDL